jgi:hypothetical protein
MCVILTEDFQPFWEARVCVFRLSRLDQSFYES